MTIALQSRLNRSAIPEGEPASLYLLIQLTAERPAGGDRPPLNLAAVVDRSGSMAGEKLAYTREALKFLIEQMGPEDYLSVVTFDDEVAVPFPAQHVANKDALKAAVAGIEAGATTNLSGGMIAGYREVKRHLAREQVSRVLLMTDGQANRGVTHPAALVRKVQQLREEGVQLSALGVGEDFNEDLLAAMAEAGGGNFYFIANPDQIPALFARELEGLLAIAAQGLEVTFAAAPGVRVVGVIGYPPSGGPKEVSLTLPDIYGGETKSLVLQLAVEAAFAGDLPLGSLSVHYTGAADGTEVALSQELTVAVTGDALRLEAPEDPEVLKQLYLARSAEALDEAIERADRGEYEAGGEVLMEAAQPLQALAESTGDEELARRAQELAERAGRVRERAYDAALRKEMRARSHQSRTGRLQE